MNRIPLAVMSSSPSPLKIAVIGGSGLIGKRHCQHVASNASTQLIAVVDPSPSGLEIAKLHNTTLYSTTQELIYSPHKPEAAIVCTPNHTHVPLSKELAQAGIHILCEKPISTMVETAKQLIEVAKEHEVTLLVGHHRRFNPYVIKAKQMIKSGSLGQITAVSGLWTTFKPSEYFAPEAVKWRSSKKNGGGVILINFIHEIDLLQYLFGAVIRIHAERAISRRSQPDDADAAEEGAAITMRFASGVVGTFIICDNVPSPHSFEQGTGENPLLPSSGSDVYRIFGTDGTLSFPDMMLSSYGDRKKSWENKISMQKQAIEHMDVAPFDSQLSHFVKVCRGQENPGCTGEEGLRALIVCEAVRKALNGDKNGGTVEVDDLNIKSRL
jgi:predicted dehydrogenase